MYKRQAPVFAKVSQDGNGKTFAKKPLHLAFRANAHSDCLLAAQLSKDLIDGCLHPLPPIVSFES